MSQRILLQGYFNKKLKVSTNPLNDTRKPYEKRNV